MTVKEALKKGTELLNNAEIETPGADAGVMLCSILDKERAFLYAHGEDELDCGAMENYSIHIFMRSAGMPIQYITGKQEFMSLDFKVTPDVLIPRQDTEVLVEAIIEYAKKSDRSMRILDIGTGSGCIAISLAKYLRNSFIVAADISRKALDIAKLNAISNGVCGNIEFVQSNLFQNIHFRGFDVIVSNPPYIKPSEIIKLQREVKDYEPLCALDGGTDGLYFYKNISNSAPAYLRNGGILAFEAGINQAGEISGLLKQHFNRIIIVKDLSGIERVVIAEL